MFDLKNIADLVTSSRLLLSLGLIWIGWNQGAEGLGLAVYLMLVDWIGDILDGALARHSPTQKHTWIGDHDLEVDIAVSFGLLGYMLASGFLSWQIAAGYLLLCIVVVLLRGYGRSLGMLVQAPIYSGFIYLAIREPPYTGWLLVTFVLFLIVITWPRFPDEVVPGFLANIRGITKGKTL